MAFRTINKERGAQKCANLKLYFKIAQIGEHEVPIVQEAGITLFYDNGRQLRRQFITIIFFEQKYAALTFGNIVVLTVDSVNIRATCASGCSPVRLTPAVGVTTGAHYRMSTGHSSPALAHEARGDP